MFVRICITVFLISVAAVMGGCDATEPDLDSGVVVEAYLQAGARFSQVRLSRAMGIDERYDFTTAALQNADVEIRRLGQNMTIEETIPYTEIADQPGVYIALGNDLVQPLGTYELYATSPAGDVVTSRTTVPGDFRILQAGPDTVEYQSDTQVEVLITRSVYPGRQAIFVFSTESLNPSIEALTPFYRDVVDPDNDADEEELADYLINESPPLNENGYQVNEDGNLQITVPWLAFAFYGPNQLRTNALDDNLYDFVRSQRIQQGGSTLAPGEIPNAIDHIDGGIGVFGSYARVATNVFVRRGTSP